MVNHKRVEQIWRREGLRVPAKQWKRKRLWLNDGSGIRLRPQYPNHVWSYDFLMDRTHDGRPIRILAILVLGFAILAGSTFKITSDMGIMTAMAIGLALVMDLLFLPALLLFREKNIENRVKYETTPNIRNGVEYETASAI